MNVFDILREKLQEKNTELKELSSRLKLSKLEERQNYGYDVAICHAIEIVNQVEQEYNNGWTACSERLPNKEEYLKDDGRFIVTDGNRVYQGLFDIYREIFVKDYFGNVPVEDECVIAWQPLPGSYSAENEDLESSNK